MITAGQLKIVKSFPPKPVSQLEVETFFERKDACWSSWILSLPTSSIVS